MGLDPVSAVIIGAVGSAVIGAGTSIYTSSRQASAQRDAYNAQYSQEMNAAFANAEANLARAEGEAGAIIAGAESQASAARGAAAAEAQGILGAAESSAGAARVAADAARAEAYNNVELMKGEAEESLRRLQNEQTVYEEKAKAKAAASGGNLSGSNELYLDTMDEENERQYGWLSKAYASQQRIGRENAQGTHKASMAYADAIMQGGQYQANAVRGAADSVANAYLEGGHITAGAAIQGAQAGWQATDNTYGGDAARQQVAWLSKNPGYLAQMDPSRVQSIWNKAGGW